MPSLVIYRPSAAALKARAALVEVDGSSVGELRDGGRVDVPVAAGRHQVRQTWKNSILLKKITETTSLEVEVGEHDVYVRLGSGHRVGFEAVTFEWALERVEPEAALRELGG